MRSSPELSLEVRDFDREVEITFVGAVFRDGSQEFDAGTRAILVLLARRIAQSDRMATIDVAALPCADTSHPAEDPIRALRSRAVADIFGRAGVSTVEAVVRPGVATGGAALRIRLTAETCASNQWR